MGGGGGPSFRQPVLQKPGPCHGDGTKNDRRIEDVAIVIIKLQGEEERRRGIAVGQRRQRSICVGEAPVGARAQGYERKRTFHIPRFVADNQAVSPSAP